MKGHLSVRAVHIDDSNNQLTFSYHNGRMTGTIDRFTMGESWHIRPHSGSLQKTSPDDDSDHILRYRIPEEEDILECGVTPGFDSNDTGSRSAGGIKDRSHLFSPFDIETSLQGDVPVDVMVVYTNDAASWAEDNEDVDDIDQVVAQMMNLSQQALDNSNLDISLRVVFIYNTDFQEDGDDSSGDLRKLTALPDDDRFESEHLGYMEEIHTLRDEYGADLVTMLAEVSDVGGIAWRMNTLGGGSRWGFSLNRVRQMINSYTLIHEIGHNMGNAHARDQRDAPAGFFGGLFDYSTGWRFTGDSEETYATIMTYLEDRNGVPGERIPYFSSPDITFDGRPTGSYDGPDAPADNVRSMSYTRHIISNYRPTVLDPPVISMDDTPITIQGQVGTVREIRFSINNEGDGNLHWTVNTSYTDDPPLAKKNDITGNVTAVQNPPDPVPVSRLSYPYLTTDGNQLIRHYDRPQYSAGPLPDGTPAVSYGKNTSVHTFTNSGNELPPSTLIQTGFDEEDGFESGEHMIHNGWTSHPENDGSFYAISTDNPSSGLQHMRLQPIEEMSQNRYTGVRLPFLGPLTTQGYVVSMDLQFSTDESDNQFHIIMNEASSNLNTVWVWFDDGDIIFRNQITEDGADFFMMNNPENPGEPVWEAGDYFNFEMRIDPLNDRIQYLVDGVFITTGNYFGGAAPEDILLAHLNYHTGETIDVDNIRVALLEDTGFPRFQLRKESGAITGGGHQDIRFDVIVDDTPAGNYVFDLLVHTNDPFQETVTLPVDFEVTETTVSTGQEPVAGTFKLHGNYPNPFNPATVIYYELPVDSDVSVEVFDLLGQRVVTLIDEHMQAGRHQVRFDASGLSSGVYIYRMRTPEFTQSRQMTLIR